jgi:hypothetical protein
MPMPQRPIDQYARAVSAERVAWEAVRHRLPGSPTFSPALWAMWRAAVEESDYAARRAKAASAKTVKTASPDRASKGWAHPVQLPAIFSRPQSPGDASP